MKKRIEDVMSGADRRSGLARTLSLASKIYGLAMTARSRLYESGLLTARKLESKVISIGNITMGGTGKTPMAVYTANLLKSMGRRPALVCRGYRGSLENAEATVVSDGRRVFAGPGQAGDEPYLMAALLAGVPVIVGKNRYASGKKAVESFGSDVIVLDDAFQHIRLRRDLDLLLMDARKPAGNGKIFPAGVLREPLEQVKRADALVVTRAEGPETANRYFELEEALSQKPVFRCRHVPGPVSVPLAGGFRPVDAGRLTGDRCLAFSGIAANEDFQRLLLGMGCDIARFIGFPDHHAYSEKDVATIVESARKNRARVLATTEKDAVKLSKLDFTPFEVFSVGVRILFIGEDEARFSRFMKNRLKL